MAKSNIYTKGGDKGMTSLVGGRRVSKTDPRLEAYGTVDELNSFIGLLVCQTKDEQEKKFLLSIQNLLFAVGSNLATDTSSTELRSASILKEEEITKLEERIDEIDASLPCLHSFILPGGCTASAIANVCRAITRRAERRITALGECSEVDPQVCRFMNRLSDYLFVLSRKYNMVENCEEISWNSRCQ